MSYECSGSWNHWQLHYLFNRLFKLKTKRTPKLCITDPLWGEFTVDYLHKEPVMQKASVSWHHLVNTAISSSQWELMLQCNDVSKIWPPTLVTIYAWLPKLVANVSSKFHHLVNTGLAVGFFVKWLPIMVAHTCKIDKIWVVYISPIRNGSIRL